MLSLGSSSCVSLRWLSKNILFKSLLALPALGNTVHYFLLASYLAVTCSVSGCCIWCQRVGFFGRCCDSLGAMLGSTVDTCSASVLGLG